MILIGTPAYDQRVTTIYLQSVFRLMMEPRSHQFNLRTTTTTLIEVARNFLASLVWQNKDYSHLLMIDADMGFEPSLIEKMIKVDQPVVTALYPTRQLDPVTGKQNFTIDPDAIDLKTRRNGFVRTKYSAGGMLLVKRSALLTLAEQCPEMVTDSHGPYKTLGLLSGKVLQCFSSVRNQNNVFVGEDVAFSARWTQRCKGEIWACIDEEISHVGHAKFKARFSDTI